MDDAMGCSGADFRGTMSDKAENSLQSMVCTVFSNAALCTVTVCCKVFRTRCAGTMGQQQSAPRTMQAGRKYNSKEAPALTYSMVGLPAGT